MRLYSDIKNARRHDSNPPINVSVDDNWPTLEQVEFHRRNAEIIRSEAIADTARSTLIFIRSTWRKLRRLTAKLRTDSLKPGATA